MKTANSLTLLAIITTLFISTIIPNIERAWADEVIKTITVGDFPRTLEYNPHNNNIHVANSHSDDFSVIRAVTSTTEEEPRTIGDLLKGIIQNPLDMANSINSANQIRDILTDDDKDNDQMVCDLIHTENEQMSKIRQILNC